jgi:hypothetical protein
MVFGFIEVTSQVLGDSGDHMVFAGVASTRGFLFLCDTHFTASIFDRETRVTSTFTDIPVALVIATVPANLGD